MKDKKSFNKWNRKKKKIHYDKERPFFDVREVWFAHLGANVGYEQDGSGGEFLRPVVVVKKFNNEIGWILPLTKTRKDNKYYFRVDFKAGESRVILSQIKLLDVKRLKYKAGYLSEEEFTELKKRLRDFLS
ncbi:MAG: type II toxin-antitoxin system PemK/MazF family toxin [Candidatus Paceibacterota bacterium]